MQWGRVITQKIKFDINVNFLKIFKKLLQFMHKCIIIYMSILYCEKCCKKLRNT